MGEHQCFPGTERGSNGGLVHRTLLLVGHQHHDHVARFGGFGDGTHIQTIRGRLLPGGTARPESDDDLRTRVTQVLRVGMALTAVSDDGEHAIAQPRAVRVRLVVHAHR